MVEIRTATATELAEMLAFERRYTENDLSLEEFRDTFERHPELFVLYVEDGEMLGEASGYPDGDAVVLGSIAVTDERQGEGIGRAVLDAFEDRARRHASAVSVASADNVEAFYRAAGYEPEKVLLRVNEDDLPEGYAERDELLEEKAVGSGVRFLYVGFEEYDAATRRAVEETYNAFEANTIYRKEL